MDFRRFASLVAILNSRLPSSFAARARRVKTFDSCPVGPSLDESGFKLVPDALRNRRGCGVIDQVQTCVQGLWRSEPVHHFREDVPMEFWYSQDRLAG